MSPEGLHKKKRLLVIPAATFLQAGCTSCNPDKQWQRTEKTI